MPTTEQAQGPKAMRAGGCAPGVAQQQAALWRQAACVRCVHPPPRLPRRRGDGTTTPTALTSPSCRYRDRVPCPDSRCLLLAPAAAWLFFAEVPGAKRRYIVKVRQRVT